jgi:5'-nucleotidase/UDP-sugar diphosphatase
VQKKYLDNFGMKYDEVLAKSSFNFEPVSEIMKNHKEARLGNLISDAYIYAVRNTEGADYEPVTAAIVPAGTIRGSFVKGGFTASDAFNASSLGIGADNIPGYPLISIYLTGKELKTACEVDASISPMLENAQLYISGVNFTFNPNRLIFNKVTKTSLQKAWYC